MKAKLLCLSLLITACLTSQADVGSYYAMKVSIETKEGKTYSGYIGLATSDLSIIKDEKGYHYARKMYLRSKDVGKNAISIAETDYHFHRYVQNLMHDSIKLYSYVRFIFQKSPYHEGEDAIPAYIGKPLSIASSEATNFLVHEVYFCPPGAFVDSKCSEEDLVLLDKPYLHTEALGGFENCEYHAFYFTHDRSATQTLISELKLLYKKYVANDLSDGNPYQLILKKVKELRKQKVLIASYCSC